MQAVAQRSHFLPHVPGDQFRSLGSYGPVYEVGPILRQLEDGDWLVKITLVETGETVEYRLSHLSEDPVAR